MDRNMGIYKIINKVNGKFYIGSSINLKERIRQHKVDLKANNHVNGYLQNSYNKHGKNNFRFEILEVVNGDRRKLREREQWYLDNHLPYDRNVGYNISRLALGNGLFGEDNPMYGNGHLVSGKKNGFYGRKHTEETKDILAKKCPNYREDNGNYGNLGIKNPLSKQIAQIDPDTLEVIKIWGASIEIQRELGYHGGDICKMCIQAEKENVLRKSNGYFWCYEKDIDNIRNMKEFKPKKRTTTGRDYLDIRGSKNPRARKVVQLSLDGEYINVYSTIKKAAEENNISANGIYSHLSNKNRKQSGGYKWMYYEDYQALTK